MTQVTTCAAMDMLWSQTCWEAKRRTFLPRVDAFHIFPLLLCDCFGLSRWWWPQWRLAWALTSLTYGLSSTTPSASPSRTTTKRVDAQVHTIPSRESTCSFSSGIFVYQHFKSVYLQAGTTAKQTASCTLASLTSSGSAAWW